MDGGRRARTACGARSEEVSARASGSETTIISQGNGAGSGTGAAKMTEDVVQVLSQLGPILEQLAGVDLDDFLRGIASLPGAAASNLRSPKNPGGGES